MMFNFFPAEGEEENDKNLDKTTSQVSSLRKSQEIPVQHRHYDIAAKVSQTTLDKYPIKYIRIADLISSDFLKEDEHLQVRNILNSTSDLISGEYEGGFKLWECTFDLLDYLEENNTSLSRLSLWSDKKVLDLGCGHGLLGIFALAKGATVLFQDYNDEVLNFLTIPNTAANFGDEGLLRSRYFDGSWSSFLEIVMKERETNPEAFQFDLILSSETIYNLEYLPDFINLVEICLKPTGSLYLAAKTCYFGVGGGIKSFINLIEETSTLSVQTVKVIKDGIQREILEVKQKTSNNES